MVLYDMGAINVGKAIEESLSEALGCSLLKSLSFEKLDSQRRRAFFVEGQGGRVWAAC